MTSSSLQWFLSAAPPALPTTPLTIPARENYTSEEVSSAVAKLLQGAIRRPYGILGERQTGTTFDDTMDAAAGVFILTPEAPYYVMLLGARRLDVVVESVVTEALDLLDAVASMGRTVRPLTSITSLGNARTALQALEGASAARQSSFEDISLAPAFQRFELHTDRFLADASGAVKVGSVIVQTPQQARTRLGSIVSALTSSMEEVQRRASLLAQGIDDYNSLNLPALLTQGVISRARGVLQERIDQLEDLSPTARLEFLRDTVLDVLAGKAAVKGFGSLSRNGQFVAIEGVGVTFTDEEHPGTPALIQSDILDPYTIVEGADELDIVVDGGPTTVTLVLPRSFIARLEGTLPEPFEIDATNDKVRVSLTGFSNLNATLVHGTRSIEQVVSEINAEVGSQPLIAEPYFNPEKIASIIVDMTNMAGSDIDFVMTPPTQWGSFGVEDGDKIVILDGVDAGSTFQIINISTNTATATLVSGTLSEQTGVSVSAGPFNRFLRIRVTDAGAASAVDNSRELGAPVITNQANATLGIFPGMLIRCRRTRGDEVAAAINASLAASVAGSARVSASATYSGSEPAAGRSEPSDPTKVISSFYRATGDVTVGGLSATFAVAGAASAGAVVGNVVTIRSSPVAGQAGRHGVITAASDSAVSAAMTSSATVAVGVELEFGLDLNQTRDQIIRIEGPSPLAGDYRTVEPNFNPTEVTLDRPLPISFSVGGQGFLFQMSIGSLRVDFQSQSTDVDSMILIDGTAAPKFFNPPVVAVGSTRYLLLDNDPRVLATGDVLEFYSTAYAEPEFSIPIRGFERGQRLLELDEELPVNLIELDFALDIPTSFARIRKAARNNYNPFQAQLLTWLALSVNETQFFRDLNRFLNPLIVNENPTISAVNTAKVHVESLVQALQQLQAVLASYQVDTVPRVDTLVDSFLSRGSDRAVDTLLEGRFRDFFGYNSEEVSYLGNTLERLRDVSRLDLPIRRKARKGVIDQEQSLGEFEEPDFEFDQSDIQDTDEPDIPNSFVDLEGGNF